jgi:hypothetical protein
MKLINTESEKWTKGLYAMIIILFFNSFLMPFVIIFWIQDLLYHSKSHWLFNAPPSAYISFFIGMIIIPIALSIYLVIKSKLEWKWIGWVTWLLILCSVPFSLLGITNYYYYDDEGVHINEILSLEEKDYQWEKMKELKEVWVIENGVTRLTDYVLITEDDTEMNLSADFSRNPGIKFKIYQKLEQYQVEITSNQQELFED